MSLRVLVAGEADVLHLEAEVRGRVHEELVLADVPGLEDGVERGPQGEAGVGAELGVGVAGAARHAHHGLALALRVAILECKSEKMCRQIMCRNEIIRLSPDLTSRRS